MNVPSPPFPREPSAPVAAGLAVLPVTGLGEVRAGDDLAAALAVPLGPGGACPARDGDVLCVASKLVSKAAGLVAHPADKERALRAATVRTVARRRHGVVVTSVVETVSGPVMAAAGIDASNAPDGLLLLPPDPDAAARELCAALRDLLGVRIGVVLSDTCSRIWRTGVADIALGAAGVTVLEDLRGGVDDTGRPLGVTVRALGDEIAAAADLVKGKATRVPAALVRGLPAGTVTAAVGTTGDGTGHVGARSLVRTGEGDWFRRPSLESVWQALGLAADDEPVAAMDPEPDGERIARALAVAATGRSDADAPGDVRPPAGQEPVVTGPVSTGPAGTVVVRVSPGADDGASWARAGARAERIRTALAAESIARPLPPVFVELTAPVPSPALRADRSPDHQELA